MKLRKFRLNKVKIRNNKEIIFLLTAVALNPSQNSRENKKRQMTY